MNNNSTDCVINAMEILKILDSTSAGIARIIIRDMGVITDRIPEIFDFIYGISHEWSFVRPGEDFNFDVNSLSPGTAYFSIVYFPNPSSRITSHAVVIVKDILGDVYVLDPQLAVQNPGIPRWGPFLFPTATYNIGEISNIAILSTVSSD